jgi:hypothetical protein
MWWLWSDWALSPATQAWFDRWFPPSSHHELIRVDFTKRRVIDRVAS